MKEINFGTLTLKNFRSYQEETVVEFSPNRLILLTGPNGSGKTTLAVDAICWALYDSTSEGHRGDRIVNKRAGKNTEVHIDWLIDEDAYKVSAYRKHTKFGNKRILYKNGVAISGGSDSGDVSGDILSKIKDILMPKDVFLNCLLFSKFTKKSFSRSSGSAEKQDIIDEVLSLSRFTDYEKIIKNKIKELVTEKKFLEDTIESKNSIITSNREMLEMEKKSTENLIARYSEDMDARKSEIAKLEKEVASLNESLVDKDKIEEEAKIAKEGMDEYNNLIANYKTLLESEITTIEANLQNAQSVEINGIITSYSEELDLANEILAQLTKRRSDIESTQSDTLRKIDGAANSARERDRKLRDEKINPIQSEITSIISRNQVLETEIRQLRKNINDINIEKTNLEKSLSTEIPICDSCGQEIHETSTIDIFTKRLEDKKQAQQVYETRLIKRDSELVSNSQRLSMLESNLKIANNEFDEIDKTREENIIKKTSETVSRLSHMIDTIDTDINVQSQKINEIKRIKEDKLKDIAITNSEKLEIEKRKVKDKYSNNLREYITSNDISKEKYSSIMDKLKLIQAASSRLDVVLTLLESKNNELALMGNSLKIHIDDSNKKLNAISEIINENHSIVSAKAIELNKIGNTAKILKFGEEAFSDRGIKSLIMDEVIPILNIKSQELSNMIGTIQVKFDNQPMNSSGETKNKFIIEAINLDKLSEFTEFSSGEKCIVDIISLLCLRNLLEYMQQVKFNILLLDEILDSLDPDRASITIDMIRKLSDQYCIIMISHTFKENIEADEILRLA